VISSPTLLAGCQEGHPASPAISKCSSLEDLQGT